MLKQATSSNCTMFYLSHRNSFYFVLQTLVLVLHNLITDRFERGRVQKSVHGLTYRQICNLRSTHLYCSLQQLHFSTDKTYPTFSYHYSFNLQKSLVAIHFLFFNCWNFSNVPIFFRNKFHSNLLKMRKDVANKIILTLFKYRFQLEDQKVLCICCKQINIGAAKLKQCFQRLVAC